MNEPEITGYQWANAELNSSNNYHLPLVFKEMARLNLTGEEKTVFELGCGNGSVAHQFELRGWSVTGVDPSPDGISQANTFFPHINLNNGSAYEDLKSKYGTFPLVTSLEVVEHVYSPRHYASTLYSLLNSGGTAIISTPYHGYWKNLALAVTGKMDAHFTALWDHGHIKFWSVKTLGTLLREAGFKDLRFVLIGRIPILAKSMIVIAKK